MAVPLVFFIVAVIGALFTLNAFRPVRRPDGLAVPSFFAGWLTGELPFHHIVWQLVATGAFVAAGALDQPIGVAGIVLSVLSWGGLLVLARRATLTGGVMDEALRSGLGETAASWDTTRLSRRSLALPFPPSRRGIVRTRNIPYGERGHRNRLDVYRPADDPPAGAARPILLFIHGGGWVIGDKREQGQPFMTTMARRGWVCIAPNYRLSPRVVFPDHLRDVKLALKWVREHGAEYGADPSFVIVSGASAGGHLASLVALTANDPGYQPGFEDVDTSVAGCVSWYGVYDMTNRLGIRGRGYVRFLERMVFKQRLTRAPEAFAAYSPMDLVHPDAPPFMVVHGDRDTLVPVEEARHFAALLRQTSRSPVVYAEVPGAQHAFEIFWSVRALQAIDGAARFCETVRANRGGSAVGPVAAEARPA